MSFNNKMDDGYTLTCYQNNRLTSMLQLSHPASPPNLSPLSYSRPSIVLNTSSFPKGINSEITYHIIVQPTAGIVDILNVDYTSTCLGLHSSSSFSSLFPLHTYHSLPRQLIYFLHFPHLPFSYLLASPHKILRLSRQPLVSLPLLI